MSDEDKTKEQLMNELAVLRQQVSELEAVARECDQAEQEIGDRKRAQERIASLNRLKEDLLWPDSLEEKLKRITGGVVAIFGGDFARIWITKPGDLCDAGCIHAHATEGPHICRHRDRCLHLVASSGRYTHTNGKVHRRVPFGCYKIGRVAAGDELKFVINDVAHDPRIHDPNWARELGLVSFAGYRLLSADGKPIGVLALFSRDTISPDEDALLEGLANTTAQVIQAATTQEALRESEEQHRTLFETMAQGVVYQDADGYITTANPAAERILGLTLDQMQGRTSLDPLWRAIHEDGSDFPGDTHPAMVALATGKPVRDVVMGVFNPKAKAYTWINVNAVPQFEPGQDKACKVYATFDDITQRVQAKEALRESERFLQDVFDAIQDGISVLDADLKVIRTNRWMERMYAHHMPLVGRHCYEVYQQRQSPCPWCPTLKTIQTGEPHTETVPYPSASDPVGWIELSAFPVQNKQGHVTSVIEYIKDITERKRAEEAMLQASRLEATATLAGGIAHDLNNLMTGVLGNAEMLQMDSARGDEEQEMLSTIADAAQRASKLAHQMLAFARGGKYRPQATDLNEIVQRLARTQARTVPTMIRIVLDADPELWNTEADPAQMSEVVLNLLSNAVEAVEGNGRITIATRNLTLGEGDVSDLGPGRYVCLAVRDTGHGMSREVQTRIFEPFYTTKFQGRGMGLAAVYGIVENHGGHISVQSEEGQGATFEVCLPAI